jgi:hypothetical protein
MMASVLLVSNAIPAMAASQQRGMNQKQLRQEADVIQKFVEDSDEQRMPDKSTHRKKYEEAFGKKQWSNGWREKDLLSCDVVRLLTNWLDYIEERQRKGSNDRYEQLYTLVWTMRSDVLQSIPANRQCEGFDGLYANPAARVDHQNNKHVNFFVKFGQPTLTAVKVDSQEGDPPATPTTMGSTHDNKDKDRGHGNKPEKPAEDTQTFTRVHLPGVENMVGTPGEPAIPAYRQLVAVPEGATPVLKVSRPWKSESLRLNLVPFQEQAVDQAAPNPDSEMPDMKTFADKPFQINRESYAKNQWLPEQPCKLTPMGQYRDVQMAQLDCVTARYNPVTNEYRMYRGLDLEIAFEGGNGTFATDESFNAFEGAAKLTTEAAINKASISKYVRDLDLSAKVCGGEELLLLTHPSFRAEADRLATHKRDSGISTSVFDVGAGTTRDTAEEIDDFIENRYDTCKVRPSYVLLMGDAEFIPTFYPAGLPDNAGSDFPYSTYVQILFDAFFPDFGTGRLPVDTLAQAKTVVDKIVKYETSPPNLGFGNGDPFYNTVGLASQFQCCRMNANGTPLNNQAGTDQRGFIETAELGRRELRDRGYTVPRIYTRTVDDGGYCLAENAAGDCVQTQAAYNGDDTPRRYFNGTLLPWEIAPSNSFQWDGDTNDIRDAWNDGRFLFVHRDHGWPGGWAHPGFSSTNVDALTNGDKLPVVWSVNCASGLFDNETAGGIYDTTAGGTYFAERAVRKADGGAIAVIGDTRNSPTWANNALTRGFFDAVWPDTLPEHGGNTSFKRLGDTLNWGKIYLASQVGVPQSAGSVSVDNMGYEYNIWNLIGDPTLSMWTANPHRFKLSDDFLTQATRLGEVISYHKDGAVITKLQVKDGEVKAIGRATVQNGQADMQYFDQPETGEGVSFIYSASYNNLASVRMKDKTPKPMPTPDNPDDPNKPSEKPEQVPEPAQQQ